VIHPFFGVLGGAERVAFHTVKSLAEGHDVTLLSDRFDEKEVSNRFGSPLPFCQIVSGDIWDFKPFFPKLMAYQMLAHQASRDRRIRQMVPVDTFDAIVSTNLPQYIPRTRKPTLQYCHFPFDPYHVPLSNSLIRRTYFALPHRSSHRRIEAVTTFIANSNFTRQAIFDRWGRSSLTIYPPCDLFYSRPGVKQDLVITVGRMSPEKRFEVMFEIARKMQWITFEIIATSDAKQIASSARYYNQLLADKPENVEVKMNVSRSVLRDEFARAKIYLHLRENEYFGISIVEAMSSGCIPVVHKSGGPLEIVTSEFGYFWETADQAAAQIAEVLSNEDLRKVRSKAAEERAKYFDARLFEERISRVVTDLSG